MSRLLSANEEEESASNLDRAWDLDFSLLNTHGIYTCCTFIGTHRPSPIDLAFANQHIFAAFHSWDTSCILFTGSDHTPILLLLEPPALDNNAPWPSWHEAHWPNLTDRPTSWLVRHPPTTPSPVQLDPWFYSALTLLTTMIEASTPLSRPTPRSKPSYT